MSIGQLITEGVGSFGDVAHVITDGLDIGSAPSTNVIATILTEGFGMNATASAFVVTEGFGSSSTPTPTPTGVQGSGGGSSMSLEEWLARHPWLRDVPIHPDWYEYPSEKERLKREIVKVAKQKKSIERELSFAKGTADLQAMLARLNEFQAKLSALMEFYRQAIAAYKAAEAEEESEFMDLMMEML